MDLIKLKEKSSDMYVCLQRSASSKYEDLWKMVDDTIKETEKQRERCLEALTIEYDRITNNIEKIDNTFS